MTAPLTWNHLPSTRCGGCSLDLDFGEDSLGLNDLSLDEIHDDLERFQEHEVVNEALSSGVDLRQYARKIDSDLAALTATSIREYEMESTDVARLFTDITSCDGILAKMQSVLRGFQADLGDISDEIKHLQDESATLSVRLHNRRAVEGQMR